MKERRASSEPTGRDVKVILKVSLADLEVTLRRSTLDVSLLCWLSMKGRTVRQMVVVLLCVGWRCVCMCV